MKLLITSSIFIDNHGICRYVLILTSNENKNLTPTGVFFTCIIKADPCFCLRDNFVSLFNEAVSNDHDYQDLRRA